MADETLDVSIESNARQIASIIGGLAHDQIPYATARALTDLAFTGMRAAKSDLEKSLTIRNRFSQAGIQVNKADKRDKPITAEVGIEERRAYLIDHILGRTRKPKESPFQAIPQTDVVKRTKTGKIRGRQRPKAMLDRVDTNSRRSAYTYRLMKRGDAEALLRWEKGRDEPVVVYWFEKSVKIDREFKMDEVVQDAVAGDYERTFIRRLEQAVASAKRAKK